MNQEYKMNALSKKTRDAVLADNYGIATFWTLEIDGQVITENARPFDAATDTLVLNECDNCFHCGMDEVSVRRIGLNFVVWYVSLDNDHEPRIPRGKVFLFNRLDYENVVGGDASLLPEFSEHDIFYLLPHIKLPDWRLGLYTIPEVPNDWLGHTILRLLSESLSSPELKVASFTDMEIETELRIGIDVPGIPETIVRWSTMNNEVWFQLVENPSIPVWFSHSEVTKQAPTLFANTTIV